MAERKRFVAEAVAEVSSPETGEVVGWLYRWDDGTESRILVTDIPLGLFDPGRASPEVGSSSNADGTAL